MDKDLISELTSKMQKALSSLREDLATIRTGRASPALVENVLVTAYGGSTYLKVKELATISTDGVRSILITPFDPSIISELAKGINSANLGFTASVDSNVIRINLPQLTAERREEYIKLAHQKTEGGRIMLRQVRHEIMADLKRAFDDKAVTEDEKERLEKEIQNITDKNMSEIDNLREKKEEELRQI